jgi:hypothetical protein
VVVLMTVGPHGLLRVTLGIENALVVNGDDDEIMAKKERTAGVFHLIVSMYVKNVYCDDETPRTRIQE